MYSNEIYTRATLFCSFLFVHLFLFLLLIVGFEYVFGELLSSIMRIFFSISSSLRPSWGRRLDASSVRRRRLITGTIDGRFRLRSKFKLCYAVLGIQIFNIQRSIVSLCPVLDSRGTRLQRHELFAYSLSFFLAFNVLIHLRLKYGMDVSIAFESLTIFTVLFQVLSSDPFPANC